MMTTTSKIKSTTCELCKYTFDYATANGLGVYPKPNDISICFNCGAIGLFNEDLTVRIANQEELDTLMHSKVGQDLAIVQKRIRLRGKKSE